MYSYGPPTHGRAKAGRPARTYIQQLCEDMGCCPEDLPRAMNDREEWRERVRDIRATSATSWWLLLLILTSTCLGLFYAKIFKNRIHCTFLFIIIIIMSCGQHRYPWPSLSTSPYHSSPLAGLQGYIPYHHIAAVCMFELVVLLLIGHMWGSTGVHHLWSRPCFSSSVQHAWFV